MLSYAFNKTYSSFFPTKRKKRKKGRTKLDLPHFSVWSVLMHTWSKANLGILDPRLYISDHKKSILMDTMLNNMHFPNIFSVTLFPYHREAFQSNTYVGANCHLQFSCQCYINSNAGFIHVKDNKQIQYWGGGSKWHNSPDYVRYNSSKWVRSQLLFFV